MKIAALLPELLRHLFKKPATVDYPFQKIAVPEGFRGTPYLNPAMCIVCRACERDCPAEAIEISVVDEAEKRFRMVIHNDRCIHCAQCVDSCPTSPKAMQIDNLHEIADDSRLKMKKEWVYVRAVIKPKAPPAPPAAPPAAQAPKA